MLELIGAIVLMYAVVLAAGIWATRKTKAMREFAENNIDSSI
tara:strand:+ start:142 stop:267 length:126 start_codon:yes stop_codon:yes gene_type:complete